MRRGIPGVTRPGASALFLILLVVPGNAWAQTTLEVRDELMRQFDASMRKVVALADAMPEGTYSWSPGAGVMEVGHVYMHIARYNYLYPTQNLRLSLPAGIEPDRMETVRDKAQVLAALRESRDWVLESVGTMTVDELEGTTMLYGREASGWAVLVQLLAHMNEHVGQSIAYARMNGVVPPWSR